MTIVQRLVEMHGGSVAAFSEGEGSEFIVRLPLRPTAPAVQEQKPVAPQPKIHRRVLIADDNQDAAVSLSMLLETMGHEMRVVADGIAAMEMADAFRPEVVILDLDMPKMNGYQVARTLRARSWGQGMLLIALSGLASESDQEDAHRAGFDAHLAKPVAITDLQALLVRGKEGWTD